MTKQQYHNFKAHPDREQFKKYNYSAPIGRWAGRLDYLAWGSTSNLFCYFTDVGTGEHYRLSVWLSSSFKPYDCGPAFDEEPAGGLYQLKTAKSKKGLPTFLSAFRVTVALPNGPVAPRPEFNAKAENMPA